MTIEDMVVDFIREKYTINEELELLRRRDTHPEEFAEYNTYVEQCIAKVKGGTAE